MKPFREMNPVRVGAASLLALFALILGALKAGDLPLIGSGDTYYAAFSDSSGIKPNDEVRIAGVRVGKVTDVTLDDGQVQVAFKVDTSARFGTETGAEIKVKTLLGAMFLALKPAGSGQLDEGAVIPSDRTRSAYDVVAAFSGLADRIQKIDLDQLGTALDTLAEATDDTPEELRSTLRGLSALSQNVAKRDQQLNNLLGNLEDVSRILANRDQDIVALMKDSDQLLRAVVARREAVHRLLVSTTQLSRELTGLVRDTRADLKPALSNLQSVVNVLLKNQANLDDSLRLMAPFYRVFTNVLGNGPWFENWIANFPPASGFPDAQLCDDNDFGVYRIMNLKSISPAVVALAVLALVAALLIVFWPSSEVRRVTAEFPRTISLYEGSDVKILGVAVGTVDEVTPSGTKVIVKFHYDAKYKVPQDAKAAVISPSIVGDRFIQLTPVYREGPTLADGARLGVDQTAVPLELDEIFGSINDLNVALGPKGVNKPDETGEGALSRLLDATARNFGGQGVQFNKTLKNLGKFTQTLANNKDELFDTITQVEDFTNTFAESDQTIRNFNDSLAAGADLLADERDDLAAVLENLGIAMREVRGFVRDNKQLLGSNIRGLNRISKTLVKRRAELDEILRYAPVALNNLYLAGNSPNGTLDTRADLGENVAELESNPGTALCLILGDICTDPLRDLLNQLGTDHRTAPFGPSVKVREVEPLDRSLGGLVEVAR